MGPTILVVDDHQLYCATLSALLQMCWPEARIVEATDSSRALALSADQHWDLILLDYQLPTLSGGDLIRHLRARAHARGAILPPLILMSTQPDVASFARALGAAAFLPKPVELAELRSVLAPYLSTAAIAQPALSSPVPTRPGQQRSAPFPITHLRPQPAALRAIQQAGGSTGSSARRHAWAPLTRLEQLRAYILDLLHETITTFPPPHAPGSPSPAPGHLYRVGDYLLHLGYLTPWQLTRALRLAQPVHQRPLAPLGVTLVANELVPSSVVSAVLLQQFRDRLALDALAAPRFIGEQLLIDTQLTPAQLALALQEQLESYRHGRWVRLGTILVRHGWLEPAVIRTAAQNRPQRTFPQPEQMLKKR